MASAIRTRRLTGRAAATPAPVAPSAAAAAKAACARRRRWRREGNGHHFFVDLLVDGKAFGRELLDRGLTAQIEPALAVDLSGLDHDLVADVDDLFNPFDPMVGQLGDVNETILVRKHFDEGAE